MKTIYVCCPKCEDEFEFGITIECDGVLRIDEKTQNCDCNFDDEEMDKIHNLALSPFET